MPKPVCVPCGGFYKVKQNGYTWQEGMPNGIGTEVLPAKNRTGWSPYKIWRSDLFECPGCSHQILSGHSSEPASIQHMENFKRWQLHSQMEVNDCG